MVVNGGWLYGWLNGFQDGLFVVRMDGWVDKNIGGLDGLRLIICFQEQNSFFSTDNFDYFFLDPVSGTK